MDNPVLLAPTVDLYHFLFLFLAFQIVGHCTLEQNKASEDVTFVCRKLRGAFFFFSILETANSY